MRLVSTNGVISTFAGAATFALGDGGPATGAQLNAPSSVALDAAGKVYIADSGHNRIRVVSGGTINTLAGTGVCCYEGDGGPASAAQLNSPWGLVVDSSGRLFVADSGNNAIRLIQTAPIGCLPTIAAIANGASDQTGAVAGGEIVVIYGSGLGPAQLVAAGTGSAPPQQLSGVTVLVNGTPASLIYVSATQLSASIPNGVTGCGAEFSFPMSALHRSSRPRFSKIVSSAPLAAHPLNWGFTGQIFGDDLSRDFRNDFLAGRSRGENHQHKPCPVHHFYHCRIMPCPAHVASLRPQVSPWSAQSRANEFKRLMHMRGL